MLIGIGIMVEERHPLKQGLKHRQVNHHFTIVTVEERHPLKQGLKHNIATPVLKTKEGELKKDIH